MIAGTTRLFAIIGDPVAQARSPEIFDARFAARGIDAAMVPLHVRAGDLAPVLAALGAIANFDGVVVTVPHKLAARRALATCTDRADAAGAVNVLRRGLEGWHGDLLDGEGFVVGLARHGIDPRGLRCAIVGAGGAGAAIAFALGGRAPRSIAIHDIDQGRAAALADRLAGHGATVTLAAPDRETDLAVNATPLGMAAGDALPFDPAALGGHAIVADVIMKPPVTPLLREAERRGHRIIEGRHMLDGQADLIWHFFGLPAAAADGIE